MASNIKIKRSDTGGNPSVLGAGELAYSGLADNGSNGGDRLYLGQGTETSGNAVNHVVVGGKFFTDMITAATSTNLANTLVRRDASGNFTTNIITAALVGNASTSTTWLSGRTISLIGDLTYTSPTFNGSSNVSGAATLATVNADTGVFGSTTGIPVITVNAKGLITSVTTAAISSTLAIAAGTGSDTVRVGTDTLTFAGGVGVATTITDNQVSFAIGQPVTTTSNVTFNDVTVAGVLYSNDISASSVTVDGDAVITGNLTINGTTTTINATNLSVSDLNITVAKDATSAAAANGAGLTVLGPTVPATLTYSSTDDRWNLNKSLNVATIYGAHVGNSTTATTWATARNLSLTGDGTATLSAVNGSAAVSAALTLATVNGNVGSFGSGTSVPNFTVNAKGLITAAGATLIASATNSILGLASFDSTNFTVIAGAVSIATVDGGVY